MQKGTRNYLRIKGWGLLRRFLVGALVTTAARALLTGRKRSQMKKAGSVARVKEDRGEEGAELLPPKKFANQPAKSARRDKSKEAPRSGPAVNSGAAASHREENRLRELTEQIERSPSLELLDQNRDRLAGQDRERLIQLYEQAVRDRMEQAGGRNDYRECGRYLTVIAGLGGRETARRIAEDWRAQYPRRRAMMEELESVGF